jgi:hypothetical protein
MAGYGASGTVEVVGHRLFTRQGKTKKARMGVGMNGAG